MDSIRSAAIPTESRLSRDESKSKKLSESDNLLAAFLADLKLRRLASSTIQTSSARIRAYLKWCETYEREKKQ
jgi:hypothetical protein